MDGWIAYQMTKCSRKTNKHGRERPNEGGVSPHHTELEGKPSLMRWCHLSRHLKAGRERPWQRGW